jgi:hypothetical protein
MTGGTNVLVCPKSTHRANCLAQMPFAAPPWRPFPQWETSCGSQAQLFERLEGMHCPTQQGFFFVRALKCACICVPMDRSFMCVPVPVCVCVCLSAWLGCCDMTKSCPGTVDKQKCTTCPFSGSAGAGQGPDFPLYPGSGYLGSLALFACRPLAESRCQRPYLTSGR